MKNDQAFLNWAHNITAEVQRLLTAKRDTSSADKLASDMRAMRDVLETPEPAPGHISDAEAVKAQAERIRDLVSENIKLQRDGNKLTAQLRSVEAQRISGLEAVGKERQKVNVLLAACKGMLSAFDNSTYQDQFEIRGVEDTAIYNAREAVRYSES